MVSAAAKKKANAKKVSSWICLISAPHPNLTVTRTAGRCSIQAPAQRHRSRRNCKRPATTCRQRRQSGALPFGRHIQDSYAVLFTTCANSLFATCQNTATHVVQVSSGCKYVRLPPCVNAKQRAVLHALAEKHGLAHSSSGEGDARQLLLGNPQEQIQVLFKMNGDATICMSYCPDGL